MPTTQTRRGFLTTLSLVGAAELIGVPQALAAEGALETTSVRLPKGIGVCLAPQHVVEELLRAEGFTEIRYVETPAAATPEAIGRGKLDFGLNYAALLNSRDRCGGAGHDPVGRAYRLFRIVREGRHP